VAVADVAAVVGSCGFCSLRGRPRLRFAGGSSALKSSGFFSCTGNSQARIRNGGLGRYTLGGLPLFFFTCTPSDGPVVADAAPDFLFLLPLGRPRPLLAGCASLGVVTANEATHKFWKNDKHGRSQMLTRPDDQSSPSTSSAFG
jgi:hypothetical protein